MREATDIGWICTEGRAATSGRTSLDDDVVLTMTIN